MQYSLSTQLKTNNLKFALWCNGEVFAMCATLEAAEDIISRYKDEGLDLAIIDLKTQKTIYFE